MEQRPQGRERKKRLEELTTEERASDVNLGDALSVFSGSECAARQVMAERP